VIHFMYGFLLTSFTVHEIPKSRCSSLMICMGMIYLKDLLTMSCYFCLKLMSYFNVSTCSTDLSIRFEPCWKDLAHL
jgi:hypothetical protein